eukprot:13013939-Alexandrium_andersonii.AAC.1
MLGCNQVDGVPPATGAPVDGPAAVGPASPVAQRPVSLTTRPWNSPFLRVGPGRDRSVGPRGQRDAASRDVFGGHG